MKVIVHTRLPDVRLLSTREREQLRRAGITVALLMESWRVAVAAIFSRVYPDDTFEVRVLHPDYAGLPGSKCHIEFRIDVESRVRATMTDQLAFSGELAEASWMAAIGTFSSLIAGHRMAHANNGPEVRP